MGKTLKANTNSKPKGGFRNLAALGIAAAFLPLFLLPVVVIVSLFYFQPGLDQSVIAELITSPLTIAVLASSLVLTALFSAVVIQVFFKPLASLHETIGRFRKGGWSERAEVKRRDEIGQLAQTFNEMADDVGKHCIMIERKAEDLSKDMAIIAEIIQSAISCAFRAEVLHRVLELLVDRYGHYDASIFTIDETGRYVVKSIVLDEAALLANSQKVAVGAPTLVGWTAENRLARLAQDVREDPLYQEDKRRKYTRSEAVLPINAGDHLLGVLDIKNTDRGAFSPSHLDFLKVLSDLLAAILINPGLRDTAQVQTEDMKILYQASRQVALAESEHDIYIEVTNAFKQLPFQSLMLTNHNGPLQILTGHNPGDPDSTVTPQDLPLINSIEIQALLPTGNPLIVPNFHNPPRIPDPLFKILQDWKSASAAFIPAYRNGQAAILLVVGTERPGTMTLDAIQPFTNLAEITATSLEKINNNALLQERMIELQTLNEISLAVGGKTELLSVYSSVHEAIIASIGAVDFLIAIYDPATKMIQIPYVFEGGSVLSIEPFPLGEGLTSILINSRQPLLLVENTEQRARELGAKVIGAAPKSWLGVPLIQGGDVIGAIIVQDLQQEHRFSQHDMRLLTTAATPIAAAIRNAQLLEASRQQTERERHLYEVSRRIRSSLDMKTILSEMTTELATALGVQRASTNITGPLQGPVAGAALIEDDEPEAAENEGGQVRQ
jgi:GAF domain-containing protein